MKSVFRIQFSYFISALLLLGLELLIAAYFNDHFIRPHLGDFFVVILLYCLLRAFTNFSVLKAAIAVLIFAFIIEISQYFELTKILGLQKNYAAKLILGTTFEWFDFVAYTAGILTVLLFEQLNNRIQQK